MAKVFLSYSSKNKNFVLKLDRNLRQLGHEPWLDEWEIKVGDCIVRKIEKGVSESDYIIVILTPYAVNSGWVEREWKAAYLNEIEKNRIIILPILLEECEIPTLLKTKKYADFTKDYTIGFTQLSQALTPSKTMNSLTDTTDKFNNTNYNIEPSSRNSKPRARNFFRKLLKLKFLIYLLIIIILFILNHLLPSYNRTAIMDSSFFIDITKKINSIPLYITIPALLACLAIFYFGRNMGGILMAKQMLFSCVISTSCSVLVFPLIFKLYSLVLYILNFYLATILLVIGWLLLTTGMAVNIYEASIVKAVEAYPSKELNNSN